jgi:hypothetical protein
MKKKVKHTINLSIEIECPHSIEYHDKLNTNLDSNEFEECEEVTAFLESELIGYPVELIDERYEEIEMDYNEIEEGNGC